MINFGHETEEPEFNKMIRKIIAKAGFGERAEITVFRREEDGSDYSVWKIAEDGVTRVLKKTSKREKDIYDAFLVSAEYGIHRRAQPAKMRPKIVDRRYGRTDLFAEYVLGKATASRHRSRL